MDKTPIWTPTQEHINNTTLTDFISYLKKRNIEVNDYVSLHQWSIDQDDAFWRYLWEYFDVLGEKGEKISISGSSKWKTPIPNRDKIWFPDAKLNYAENLLHHCDAEGNDFALCFANETGEIGSVTWKTLGEEVSIVQQWLKRCDVKAGDVVAGYLPNLPQTMVAMLATSSLGAIWSSISPDFGSASVIERFGEIEPKAIFVCHQYQFAGKSFDMREKNKAILDAIPSLHNCCYVDSIPSSVSHTKQCRFDTWQHLIDEFAPHPLEFTRVSFNDPLFILYSSGTTGKPKCITHSVGGTLLNHLKEHQLHCDIKASDRVMVYTTCGWMMWNWLASALASKATLLLYDGSPLYPNDERLWKVCEQFDITLFCCSAKYLEVIEKHHYQPNQNVQLPHLRTLCSTGSVLYPEQFDYIYQSIKSDLHLASISGGTDICGCFVIGNPISPVYRGECQGAALGVNASVYSNEGKAIIDKRGELVCLNALPNFPLYFWNDTGEKYHQAYWGKFDNAWHHGDEVEQSQHGGFTFYGRSDATLNPGGVRIGTAEIYREVNAIAGVVDSIAVGKQIAQHEHIWLFVQLEHGHHFNEALEQQIKHKLRTSCSPRHVPSQILPISDTPKTRSGKLVELAVKQIINGRHISNLSAVANPEVLTEIHQLITGPKTADSSDS